MIDDFKMEIASFQSLYNQASFLLHPSPLCSLPFLSLSPGLLRPAFPRDGLPCYCCLFSPCADSQPKPVSLDECVSSGSGLCLSCYRHIPPRNASRCSRRCGLSLHPGVSERSGLFLWRPSQAPLSSGKHLRFCSRQRGLQAFRPF